MLGRILQLLTVILFFSTEALPQTGIEQFNYSVGDVFFYREFWNMNPSAGIDLSWGTDTKYRIESKKACADCYEYAVKGVKRKFSADNQRGTYSAQSYHFVETLFICPQDVAYWTDKNARELKGSIISGIQTGTIPTDQTILGSYEKTPVLPSDFTLNAQYFYESDTAGIQIATALFTGPKHYFVHDLIFAPDCEFLDDNDLFRIQPVGGEIYSNATFDFDSRQAYRIRLKATTDTGESLVKEFTLELKKGARPKPEGILLSNTRIAESLPRGTMVGKLDVTPDSAGRFFEYFFSNRLDYSGEPQRSTHPLFEIRNDTLFTKRAFDHETKASETIEIYGVTFIGAREGSPIYLKKTIEIEISDSIDCTAEIVQEGFLMTSKDPGVAYYWTGGSQQSTERVIKPILNPPSNLTPFQLTVTYANGCSATSEPYCGFIKPYIGFANDKSLTAYSFLNGEFSWYKDGIFISKGSSVQLSGAGKYQVQTSLGGCLSALSDPYDPSLECGTPEITLSKTAGGVYLTVSEGNLVKWIHDDGKVTSDLLLQHSKTVWIEKPGSYRVEITCANGKALSSPFFVDPCVFLDEILTNVSDSTLTATPAKSYKWFLDGNLLPDTTQTIALGKKGTYHVEITSDLGCVIKSSPFLHFPSMSGRNFHISMNVERSQLFISTQSETSAFVRILDSTGQPIQKTFWNPAERKTIIFDIQGYAAGLYVVQVNSEQGAWAQKILKY